MTGKMRRLQRFGNVRREAVGGELKMVEGEEVPGRRPMGRLEKNIEENSTVRQDFEMLELGGGGDPELSKM